MKTKYKNISYTHNGKKYHLRYYVDGKPHTKCFTGPDALEKALKAREELFPIPNKFLCSKPNVNKKSDLPVGICYTEYKRDTYVDKTFQVSAGTLNGKHLKKNIRITKNRPYEKALKEAIRLRAEFIKLRNECIK